MYNNSGRYKILDDPKTHRHKFSQIIFCLHNEESKAKATMTYIPPNVLHIDGGTSDCKSKTNEDVKEYIIFNFVDKDNLFINKEVTSREFENIDFFSQIVYHLREIHSAEFFNGKKNDRIKNSYELSENYYFCGLIQELAAIFSMDDDEWKSCQVLMHLKQYIVEPNYDNKEKTVYNFYNENYSNDRKQLYNILKKANGVAPSKFLNKAKIEMAENLLDSEFDKTKAIKILMQTTGKKDVQNTKKIFAQAVPISERIKSVNRTGKGN